MLYPTWRTRRITVRELALQTQSNLKYIHSDNRKITKIKIVLLREKSSMRLIYLVQSEGKHFDGMLYCHNHNCGENFDHEIIISTSTESSTICSKYSYREICFVYFLCGNSNKIQCFYNKLDEK